MELVRRLPLFLADLESGGTNKLVRWEVEIEGAVLQPLTWPNPAAIQYGVALGSTQLNASSSVAGTFLYNPPSGTRLNAGNGQTLSVLFIPDDQVSYVNVTTNVTLNVLPAPLNVTAVSTQKVYGAALPALPVAYSGFVNGDTTNSLATQATASTVATASSAAQTYPITAAGAASPNYTFNYVSGNLTITRAPLTVAAVNTNKVYGAAVPALAATYSGFVNGDTTGSLISLATVTTPATAGSPVANYPINVSGAASPNYTIGHVNGTLAVTSAALTVTALGTNKVYGAAMPVLRVAYSGFVNGDSINQLTSQAGVTTAANVNSPVGTYALIASGAASPNYTFNYVQGQIVVTRASTSGLVSSSVNPALPGQTVLFEHELSVMVPGGGIPNGTVQFKIDGVNSGSPVPLVNGRATYGLSTLSPGSHTVQALYAGSGNFIGTTNTLSPVQLINTPPVAGTDTMERWATNGSKILIATLLENDSDAEDDAISWVSFTPLSVAGGVVIRDGDWIYYEPPSGFTNVDSFTYTITDIRGASATGTVYITLKQGSVPSPNLMVSFPGGGTYLIRFDGIPGVTYRMQYAETLVNPVWRELVSVTADEFGVAQFLDVPPPGSPQRYYRSVYP